MKYRKLKPEAIQIAASYQRVLSRAKVADIVRNYDPIDQLGMVIDRSYYFTSRPSHNPGTNRSWFHWARTPLSYLLAKLPDVAGVDVVRGIDDLPESVIPTFFRNPPNIACPTSELW